MVKAALRPYEGVLNKMQPKKFVLMMLSSVLLLALVLGVAARPASPAAAAAPVAVSSECFTVFLPMIIKAPSDTSSSNVANTAPTNALADPCATTSDMTDFNGDGYADLAIGVPRDNISLVLDAGAVNVLYGTASGLTSANSQLWTQTMAGDFSQGDEFFGTAVSTGDYNGDGYTDLAVGAPGEDINSQANAGQVNIFYGSATGLIEAGAQTLSQADPTIEGVAEADDILGQTLTSGDFDGDGYADLVVGVPHEGYESGGIIGMGAVNIFYGSAAGLRTDNELILHPAQNGVDGTPIVDGNFGAALATGDFDGDARDDLAVGIPGYDLAGINRAGAVEVFYGSDTGISIVGEQMWRQGINGIPGSPEDFDGFGFALATGDFDKNGRSDLAIGVPFEDVAFGGGDVNSAGAIHILYGYSIAGGLSSSGNQLWHQGLPEVLGMPNAFDSFGRALVAADFDGNGADDLAVGVPYESPSVTSQGMVQVFYSNGSILHTDNQDVWLQGTVIGAPEFEDHLGWALGAANYNGDAYADLVIGVPFEGVDVESDAGAINVIYGANSGLSVVGNQIWHQDMNNIPGTAEANDRFGYALSQ